MRDAEEGGIQDTGGGALPAAAEEAKTDGGVREAAGPAQKWLLSPAGSRVSVLRRAEAGGLCLILDPVLSKWLFVCIGGLLYSILLEIL